MPSGSNMGLLLLRPVIQWGVSEIFLLISITLIVKLKMIGGCIFPAKLTRNASVMNFHRNFRFSEEEESNDV